MTSLWKAFNFLPIFTRCLLGSAIIVPILGKVISPMFLVLVFPKVFQFELWRLYTSVFYTGLDFNWLFNMFFLYQQSLYLEQKMRKADFLFFLTFVWVNLLAIAYFQDMILLFRPFICALVYMWSRFNQETIVTFYFGIQFPGKYLPWVYVALEFLNPMPDPIPSLLGILVAHGYYYVTTNELLSTPAAFDTIYNNYLLKAEPTEGPHVSNVNAGRAAGGPGARPAARPWGQGHRLG